MESEPRSLPHALRLEDAMPRLRTLVDLPVAEAIVTGITAESGNSRTITVSVRDRLSNVWSGRWLVRVIVGTAASGGPGGTQTLAVTKGTSVAELVAGQVLDLLTDTDGVASFSVTFSGASNRYIGLFVLGHKNTPQGPYAWT